MIAHGSPFEHGLLAVAACAAVVGYGLCWLRLPPARRSVWRLWAWAGGIVALAVSTSPPFERLAGETFLGHMVQHLVMILMAAPLLVVAAPVRTVREGARLGRPTPGERRIARWWHRSGWLVAPAAFVGVLYVTHLTAIYDEALSSRLVHDAEHAAYLGAAVGLWAVVVAPGRASAVGRVGLVFGVIGASALLGVILLTASTPLIDTYAARLGEEAALDDQRAAASLMWVGGMALTLPLLITAVWRWASAEERAAERREALLRPVTTVGRESGP